MILKNNLYKTSLIVFLAGLTASCTSIPLQPGAAQVKIISHRAPASCKLLGVTTSFTTNGRTTEFMSKQDLVKVQSNVLKNHAASVGGNLIVLKPSQTTYAAVQTHGPNHPVTQPTELVESQRMTGNVYLCPTSTLKKLPLSDDLSLALAPSK